MRWKSNKVNGGLTKRKFFAFLPITIKRETRWLEIVVISGVWHYCTSDNSWYFESFNFEN
jgi:hypothetical protein